MKMGIKCAGMAVLALGAALGIALACCGARYAALVSAVAREGGADAVCCALVYGREMSDAELARAQERLGPELRLARGAQGRVYGCFAAATPAAGALCEMRLRGELGLGARADRWCCARGGTGFEGGREIALRPRGAGSTPMRVVERLLAGRGERAAVYGDARSASARGERYHAAARAGANIEYMLAEGYLPVDY